jgi:ribonuclease HII
VTVINTEERKRMNGWEYFERILRPEDFRERIPWGISVCGVDEAGRGPLAGPVSAGAVILPDDFPKGILDDSKAISAHKREIAYGMIISGAIDWAVGWATFEEIGEMNILRASLLAMRRAILSLSKPFDHVFIDGNQLPELGIFTRHSDSLATVVGVIKGDSVIPAIMAASILAKVARDRVMERFGSIQPEYGFADHKGYPTAAHKAALAELGPSLWQRKGFRY